MPIDYDKIMKLTERIARQVSDDFPACVDWEDTQGALLLWVAKKQASLERLAEESNWEAQLSPTLRKVAFEHCGTEKAQAEGYDPSDVYNYSIPELRELIADAMDHENWQSFNSFGDGQPKAAAQSYGDRTAKLVDVKAALEKLDDDSYNLLVSKFKYGCTNEELGLQYDVTPNAARMRSERALRGLRKHLGYKVPREGSEAARRAVKSNAAWRAQAAHRYDG